MDEGLGLGEHIENPSSPPLSRRTFMEGAAVMLGAGAVLATLPAAARTSAALPTGAGAMANVRRTPVVGFHMDRPYLDMTGTAEPYIPPAGLRSGDALAELSEERLASWQAGYL